LSINAAALKDAGVRAITVTVNAIEPEILAKIIRTVTFEGKTYQGIEAATLLIQKQHEGLELVREFASIKINTVLIPGINDKHIPKIAEFAASVRARYYNIIPLLPFGEFKNAKTPTCDDLSAARAEAAKFVNVFYHCKHCRADACGVPGKSEFGDVLYNDATLETFSHG
jgi:nitrogen fixation protein NifB